MNKNLHRLIFNPARGMRMAVSETASGHGKGQGDGPGKTGTSLKGALTATMATLALAACAFAASALCTSAHAQIAADPSAPGNQRPTVLVAPNGVPLINIQTPSAAGVSRNTYSQFDVNAQGAILNNARSNAQTQLGGWVQGNPWLAGGAARVILNEVNSNNPSQLRGFVEVAGSRAEVVIANPAGVNINGGGFINASRVTVTTGTPVMNGGNLEGFVVQKGLITVNGAGLDSSQTDFTGIMARAVEVNAGIWAKELKITTGANQIDVTQSAATPIAGSGAAPAFALDVSQLGGMYAGKITLVGTEAGLGVRNAGTIGASAGQVVVTVDGMLQNSGRITSTVANSLDARGGISNTAGGTIYSTGDTSLGTQGNISNAGLIGALGNTTVAATGANSQVNSTVGSVLAAGLRENGTLAATSSGAGKLSIGATQSIAAHGQNLSAGEQVLSARSIDISGSQISAQSLSLVASAGNIDASAAKVAVDQGLSISTSGLLRTDAAKVSANQLSITVHDLSNVSGEIIQTGPADTSITATGAINNTGGNIASNGNTRISAQSLVNQGGTVQAAGAAHLDVTTLAALDNSAGGSLSAGGNATVATGSLNNNLGQIKAGGTLIATANQAISNAQGLIAANGAVALTATSLDNTRGAVASIQNSVSMTSTGVTTNDSGRVEAAGHVTLSNAGLSNTQAGGSAQAGSITGANVTIDTHGQTFNNTGGTVAAGQGATLSTGALNNNAGLIQAGGALFIDTHGQTLTNTNAASYVTGEGGITAQGTATLRTADLNNAAGFVGAQGALSITGAHLSNTAGGQIIGESTVTMTGTGFDNQGGQVQALGDVSIDAGAGTVNNSASLIRSAETVTLTAATVINSNTGGTGQGIEGKNVAITAGAIANNSGAIRADNDATLSSSASINNSSGLISAGHVVTLQDTASNKTLAITNSAGTIIADQNTIVKAAALGGDGKVLSKGDLSITLSADFNNSGEVTANQNASISTAGNLSNSGKLKAGNILTVSANNIGNAQAGDMAGAVTQITASGTLTNRGVIDGQTTQVNAGTLNNLGTGRIYGDVLSIQAATVNNDVEGGVAPVIAARVRLDIGATTSINNSEHALIFSAGDMAIGGSLDANRQATGQAGNVNNGSATIEALGNLAINAAQINNTNNHFSTQVVPVSSAGVTEYQGSGSGTRYVAGTPGLYTYDDESLHLATPEGSYEAWSLYQYTRSISETVVTASDPGQILAGGSMTINATNVFNDKSRIIAGGALSGSIASLTNTEVAGERFITDAGTAYSYWRNHRRGRDDTGTSAAAYNPATVVQGISLTPTVYRQFTAPGGSGTTLAGVALGSVSGATSAAGTASAAARPGAIIQVTSAVGASAQVVRTLQINTTLPNNSLFRVNPNPGSHYFVETDPRFASYRQWLSSDYLLSALSIDPSLTQKRLGDGFYEQKLIREQVAELTGRRFLDGYQSDEEQYKALMNAGVTFAQQYQLRPGIALSALQMAQLTSDIVWLVERDVTLPDGTIAKALVPQVYVRVKEGDLTGDGALISASAVNLKLSGDLTNSGTIAGRTVVALNAQNIHNLAGRIRGADVSVAARNDLNNTGGQIIATDSLVATAGRDLNVISTTRTQTGGTGSRINIDRVAGLYVSNPDGTLVASAGRDVNIIAGVISNAGQGGNTVIAAGNNLNLGTVTESSSNAISWSANNFRADSQSSEVGSIIQAAGGIQLSAGKDLNARAAQVEAGGALVATAGNNINISAGQSSQSLDEGHQHTSKGFLSKKTVTTRETMERTDSIASNFSGNSLVLSSGRDLNIQASNLSAVNALTLVAGGDLNITEAHNTLATSQFSETRKNPTGLGKALGVAQVLSGGITIGSALLTKSTAQQQAQNTSSTAVGSTLSAGTLSAFSGRDTTLRGATLVADGDITLSAARNLTLTSAQSTQTSNSQASSSKSGQIGSLWQPAIGTINKTQDETGKSTRQEGSSVASLGGNVRLQAGQNYTQTASQVLALAQTPSTASGNIDIEAKNVLINEAYNSGSVIARQETSQKSIGGSVSVPLIDAVKGMANVAKSAGQTNNPRMQALAAATLALQAKAAADVAVAAAAGNLGGIKVSVSLSNSKSQSISEQAYRQAQGSTINASGNANIRATSGVIGTPAASAAPANPDTGNIRVVGSDITAGRNVNLQADGQLDILASKSSSEQHSTNSASGTSVGIGFAMGGAQNGFTLELAASKARGNADGNDTSYTNSHITGGSNAGNTVTLQSGGDTTIKGATVTANTVQAEVGGNLNIESLQDSAKFDTQQSSSGFTLSLCIPPFCYGTSTGSVSAGKSKIDSDFKSVTEQSGIKAGDGGFQVNVQGNTDLKGAVIASTDKAVNSGNNSFTTGGTLSTSDIQNKADYKGEGYSVTVGTSAGTSSAGVGQDKGDASSTTSSGISGIAGNTAVRSKDAETGIAKIFDADKVQKEINAQVAITAEFGKQASTAWGEYANKKFLDAVKSGKEEDAKCWAPDGACRAGGHALIGGLTGGAAGAASAAASSVAAPHMQAFLISTGVTPAAASAITQLSAFGVGNALGGAAGGAAAFNETGNNAVIAIPLIVEGVIAGGALAARTCLTSPACLRALQLGGTALVAKVASVLTPDELSQIPGFGTGSPIPPIGPTGTPIATPTGPSHTGGNQLDQPPGVTTTGGSQTIDPNLGGNTVGGYGAGSQPVFDPLTMAVPPSLLGSDGKLLPGINGSGTPIPMLPTANPNQTAEDFAKNAFNGQTPVSVQQIGGGWLAKLPDGSTVLYRPAGQATGTAPTTASVDINSSEIKALNNGVPAKFKFPKD